LRGLGSRAPYFHNGSANTLNDVVRFYNTRFNIGFTSEEIRKVVLFLRSGSGRTCRKVRPRAFGASFLTET